MLGIQKSEDGKTIFIPLPKELWRQIEGGCCCLYCSENRVSQVAYWDTLAVSIENPDFTWTPHCPEFHGAKKKKPV